MRRPTVRVRLSGRTVTKFRHHEAATDPFGQSAEHRCGPAAVDRAQLAVYVVARIVLVPLPGKHLGNSN